MKRGLLQLLIIFLFGSSASAQLTVAKMIGRGANEYYPGFSAVLAEINIPLNDDFNKVIRLELLDLTMFFPKNEYKTPFKGSLAAKLAYRYTFNKTHKGLYWEPKAGYCFFIEDYKNNDDKLVNKSGIAAVLEGGYIWEVGKLGNLLGVGISYKADYAGRNHNINAVGITISYNPRGLVRLGTKWY
jgi:hypothetical protein